MQTEEEDVLLALSTRKSIIPRKERQNCDHIEIEEINLSRKSSSSSDNSNTWQLLLANCSDSFEISHIGSNIIQIKKHWLDRPNISWQRIHESRVKCEKWLNKI